MVVTNAATKDGDLEWILKARQQKGFSGADVKDVSDEMGKIDIQGPVAQTILSEIVEGDLSALPFYHAMDTRVAGMPALVSRSGYTGEDGFEVYATISRIVEIWDLLLRVGDPHGIKPAGLGARDTLRLEAGMMLFGHEMCQTVTPYEVIYGWITDLDKDFIGRDALKKQKEDGDSQETHRVRTDRSRYRPSRIPCFRRRGENRRSHFGDLLADAGKGNRLGIRTCETQGARNGAGDGDTQPEGEGAGSCHCPSIKEKNNGGAVSRKRAKLRVFVFAAHGPGSLSS